MSEAVATVAGATCGGLVLRALGEDSRAYFAVFALSGLLRLAAVPLLARASRQPAGRRDSLAMLSRNVRARP